MIDLLYQFTEDPTVLLATQGLLVSLLVLVCLNVAILVYTRTAMRQAEIGLRTALGANLVDSVLAVRESEIELFAEAPADEVVRALRWTH